MLGLSLHTSSFKIPKVTNKMENRSDEKFIIMQATIESNKQEMRSNKQDYDEKMTQFTVKFETMLAVISNQLNTLVSSPTQRDASNPPDPTTVVTDFTIVAIINHRPIHTKNSP